MLTDRRKDNEKIIRGTENDLEIWAEIFRIIFKW